MEKKKIYAPSDVPDNMTDKEAADFWENHSLTEEFFDQSDPLYQGDLPPIRNTEKSGSITAAKTITLRMDVDTINRLHQLANLKQKEYQTLLKQFVIERLYEEEKKMGV